MDAAEQAVQHINREAFGEDGIVAMLRAERFPPVERLEALRKALEPLALHAVDWIMLDRRLACALYLLSGYLENLAWTDGSRGAALAPEAGERLTAILVLIDEIFGVNDYTFSPLLAGLRR
jgi:hypothetical protein